MYFKSKVFDTSELSFFGCHFVVFKVRSIHACVPYIKQASIYVIPILYYTQNVSISKAGSYAPKSSSTVDIPTSIKNSDEVLETISPNGGVKISLTTTSIQRETTATPHKKNTSRTETLKKTRSEITSTASTTEATPTQSSSMSWPSRTSKVKFQNSTVSPSSITYSVKGKSISLIFMNVERNKTLNKYKFGKALSWSLSMFYRHYFSRKRSKYTA